MPRKPIEKQLVEASPEVLAKIRRRAKENVRNSEVWADPITRAVCKRCKAQCCYLLFVILDREAAERRLHEFKGDYSYPNTAHALRDLGRKNTQAPVLKRREDGSCIYFDREKRRCTIYKRRPAACRVFFCGRGTKKDWPWKRIKLMEKNAAKQKKNKEEKLRSIESMRKNAWKPDREMPMLDAILNVDKLWNSGAPAMVQKNAMKKVVKAIREEHEYLLENEPQDQFHACVLLGALNIIEGALSRKKVDR